MRRRNASKALLPSSQSGGDTMAVVAALVSAAVSSGTLTSSNASLAEAANMTSFASVPVECASLMRARQSPRRPRRRAPIRRPS